MKLLLVLTCVIAGSYVIPLAMDRKQLIALEHAIVTNAQCSAGCRGDFPVSDSKFAEAGAVHRS
jgi:hypothetical protein